MAKEFYQEASFIEDIIVCYFIRTAMKNIKE